MTLTLNFSIDDAFNGEQVILNKVPTFRHDQPRQPSYVSSPLGVVVFPPELIVRLIHKHAIFEEHDVEDPPDEDDKREDEEEFPVGPRHHSDEDCDEQQIE